MFATATCLLPRKLCCPLLCPCHTPLLPAHLPPLPFYSCTRRHCKLFQRCGQPREGSRRLRRCRERIGGAERSALQQERCIHKSLYTHPRVISTSCSPSSASGAWGGLWGGPLPQAADGAAAICGGLALRARGGPARPNRQWVPTHQTRQLQGPGEGRVGDAAGWPHDALTCAAATKRALTAAEAQTTC